MLNKRSPTVAASTLEIREELDTYLRSGKFSALLGTRILLRSALPAFMDKVATREGIETIMTLHVDG
jgi:hypothetical protein